jgi:hypothetical protein
MKTAIVITTINGSFPPLEPLLRVPDAEVILVGDLKTPAIAERPGLTYLPVDDPPLKRFRYAAVAPVNHYARKNLGYLHALSRGAEIVYDTDDDNLPIPGEWAIPAAGTVNTVVPPASKFLNVYRAFSDGRVWPRGFPLRHVKASFAEPVLRLTAPNDLPVGVWCGLVQGDPDVDAIHRLVGDPCDAFRSGPPLALPDGVWCPFNSQNTFWFRAAFPFLYLPATVSFRHTDILRGYVVQRLLWATGLHLGFLGPCARQERNPHDLLKDFVSEIPCYTEVERIAATLGALALEGMPAGDAVFAAYRHLAQAGLVSPTELEPLLLWLEDCAALTEPAGATSTARHA